MAHHRSHHSETSRTSYHPRYHAKIAERDGFHLGNVMEEPRTLFVGNLDPAITEDFLAAMFNQVGAITKAKMTFEGFHPPYAFIEFRDNHEATLALDEMNNKMLLGSKIHVQFAIEAGQPDRKIDTTRHFHVFVGDLSSEVDTQKLHEAFSPFGVVSEAKVIRDTATNKPKGYGFVSYPKREDAERAIEQMNGQWLGRRTIRTNWATRKPDEGGNPRSERREHRAFGRTFDDIYNQTTHDNTSVYVGNINSLSEDEIREAFIGFGQIAEVRIFRTQGYAFVKFEEKTPAAQAILQMHNQTINGIQVRCSWGKNAENSSNQQNQQRGPFGGPHGPPGPFGGPFGPPPGAIGGPFGGYGYGGGPFGSGDRGDRGRPFGQLPRNTAPYEPKRRMQRSQRDSNQPGSSN